MQKKIDVKFADFSKAMLSDPCTVLERTIAPLLGSNRSPFRNSEFSLCLYALFRTAPVHHNFYFVRLQRN